MELLASLWHSVSHSEHNFTRCAAEYRCVSSISGWSCSIFHFLRISLFQQYYNYFWNNCMEADCPKNLSLLFEEFYCRNVDAFGIVTLSMWCWNKLDVLYLSISQATILSPTKVNFLVIPVATLICVTTFFLDNNFSQGLKVSVILVVRFIQGYYQWWMITTIELWLFINSNLHWGFSVVFES